MKEFKFKKKNHEEPTIEYDEPYELYSLNDPYFNFGSVNELKNDYFDEFRDEINQRLERSVGIPMRFGRGQRSSFWTSTIQEYLQPYSQSAREFMQDLREQLSTMSMSGVVSMTTQPVEQVTISISLDDEKHLTPMERVIKRKRERGRNDRINNSANVSCFGKANRREYNSGSKFIR